MYFRPSNSKQIINLEQVQHIRNMKTCPYHIEFNMINGRTIILSYEEKSSIDEDFDRLNQLLFTDTFSVLRFKKELD